MIHHLSMLEADLGKFVSQVLLQADLAVVFLSDKAIVIFRQQGQTEMGDQFLVVATGCVVSVDNQGLTTHIKCDHQCITSLSRRNYNQGTIGITVRSH